jgi:hypothetical protein
MNETFYEFPCGTGDGFCLAVLLFASKHNDFLCIRYYEGQFEFFRSTALRFNTAWTVVTDPAKIAKAKEVFNSMKLTIPEEYIQNVIEEIVDDTIKAGSGLL